MTRRKFIQSLAAFVVACYTALTQLNFAKIDSLLPAAGTIDATPIITVTPLSALNPAEYDDPLQVAIIQMLQELMLEEENRLFLHN